MSRLSRQTATMLCLALLLVSAVAFFFIRRQLEVPVSDDALSEGIAARWNAALPGGFAKQSAEHIGASGGCNFAHLTYEKDVVRLLTRWTEPDADFLARWQALLDEQRGQWPEDAALLDAAPVPGAGWVSFSLTGTDEPRNEILLCYESRTRTMLVAERRVEETP